MNNEKNNDPSGGGIGRNFSVCVYNAMLEVDMTDEGQ